MSITTNEITIEKNCSKDHLFDILGEDEAHLGFIVNEDGEFKIEDCRGKHIKSAASFEEAVREAKFYFGD